VFVAAFLVARSCGSSQPSVSQEEAIEIARAEIDFEPARVQVRNVPSGLEGRRTWAVSLYTGTPSEPGTCRIVEIDADDGSVSSVARC
jgi:hypothetical protein